MRISDWSSDVCSSDLFREGALFIFPIGKASTRGNFHPLPWHSDDLQFDAPDPRIPVVLEILRDTGRTKGIDDRLRIGLPGMEDGKVRPQALVKESRFHARSEEHTYELKSLMRISYATFCFKNNNKRT